MKAPFELLYVSVVDISDRRVYTKPGPARGRITSTVDQQAGVFRKSCELWTVGAEGWTLIFSAEPGDHYSTITWKTAIESNKRRAAKEQAWQAEREEAKARAVYEELRERFEA